MEWFLLKSKFAEVKYNSYVKMKCRIINSSHTDGASWLRGLFNF